MKMILTLFSLVAVSAVSGSSCHFCDYSVKNCSISNTDLTTVESESKVCDAKGQVVFDDLFCSVGLGDKNRCTCSSENGFSCVSLELGCQRLIHMKNQFQTRCISGPNLQRRFTSCTKDIPNAPEKSNMADDWIFFNNPEKCTSEDCHAVQKFQSCGVVECGHVITAWKMNKKYHFIIDGSRSSDMKAGEFHYSVDHVLLIKKNGCQDIQSEIIQNCYTLQTRNDPNGEDSCFGQYLQFNEIKKGWVDSVDFHSLNWPLYILVVGSIIGAISIVVVTVVLYFRIKHQHNITNESEKDFFIQSSTPSESGIEMKNLRQRTPLSPVNSQACSNS